MKFSKFHKNNVIDKKINFLRKILCVIDIGISKHFLGLKTPSGIFPSLINR